MEDKKTIDLPSGKKAVIRTYTTRSDDRQASAILNEGVSAETQGAEQSIKFSMAAIQASTAKYVELLTETIDGEQCTPQLLDTLRTEDYNAIEDAVTEVVKRLKVSKKS